MPPQGVGLRPRHEDCWSQTNLGIEEVGQQEFDRCRCVRAPPRGSGLTIKWHFHGVVAPPNFNNNQSFKVETKLAEPDQMATPYFDSSLHVQNDSPVLHISSMFVCRLPISSSTTWNALSPRLQAGPALSGVNHASSIRKTPPTAMRFWEPESRIK